MYKIINICRNTQCFSNLKVQFRSVKNGKFVRFASVYDCKLNYDYI